MLWQMLRPLVLMLRQSMLGRWCIGLLQALKLLLVLVLRVLRVLRVLLVLGMLRVHLWYMMMRLRLPGRRPGGHHHTVYIRTVRCGWSVRRNNHRGIA